MNVLIFINTYITKYLYIAVIVGIIVALIVMFVKGVKPLVKSLNELLVSINNVQEDVNKINEDIESITYTLNNSIPFFVDVAFDLIIVKSILEDYFKTKKSKRSLLKSTINEYQNVSRKYNKKLNPDTVKEMLTIIKQFA